MNLYVLLNFFDEDDQMLREMIESLAPLKPHCVIACDGAYENYPGEETRSPDSNFQTITQTSHKIGAATDMSGKILKWQGDEVAKRQRLLDCMFDICSPGDWFLVADSDYLLHQADGVREALEETDLLAAECSFFEGRLPDGEPGSYPARLLMRCTPGLKMGRAHHSYYLPDSRHHHILGNRDSTVPALDLTEQMLVEHRVHQRPEERRDKQRAYYEQRDSHALEE